MRWTMRAETAGGTASGASARAAGCADAPGALYLHIPFCRAKCAYCDFASWACADTAELLASYRRALEAQLDELADAGLLDACATAYLGGGTPTLLGAGAAELAGRVTALAAPSEFTCEANPESLAPALAARLAAAGVTRLSIGVQSLDDSELAELGRLHDAAGARRAVACAHDAGLATSIDLMCALPHQHEASWQRTLEAALALPCDHISVYPLQIEEGTPLARRFASDDRPWNDPDVQAARMEQAAAVLGAAGFARYEVASYARPNMSCRHNIAYWTGITYLGLGTSAASMLDHSCYMRLRALCPQLPAASPDAARARLRITSLPRAIAARPGLADLAFEVEFLDASQACAEDLMLAARLVSGLDAALIERARRVIGGAPVQSCLDRLVALGLLAPRDGQLAPTERGWLMGNELYGALWGLADGETTFATSA